MIPFGGETVTLVRRQEAKAGGKTQVTYESCLLRGCSWRRTTRIVRSDSALVSVESVVCRVPAGQAVPKRGDLLILGEAAVTVSGGADYQRIIEQYRDSDGAFVAAEVSDNARPGAPLPHYAARS